MSMPHEIEVTCKNCGHLQPFIAWQSLNAELNPDAKEALLKGELTRFVCDKCNSTAELVYPLLYHDTERQLMIWLRVGEGAADIGPIPIGRFMQDYQFRVVKSRNQLVEKIRIFESGLDDRVLEFAKFLLRRGAKNSGRALNGELFFEGQGKTGSGERAIQFLLLEGGRHELFTTTVSQLNEMVRELGEKLPRLEAEASKWISVDEQYATNLASKF